MYNTAAIQNAIHVIELEKENKNAVAILGSDATTDAYNRILDLLHQLRDEGSAKWYHQFDSKM